jgi:hypothetical protein
MRKTFCLLFVMLLASSLPVRAELLQVDLSIFGMD